MIYRRFGRKMGLILNVTLFYENWHKANTIGHFSSNSFEKGIPFDFIIKLPSPQYERVIVARNQKGQIVRSIPIQ